MTYFRELPNIEYQSPLSTRSSSEEYVAVKNLFRRVKLRDDLKGSTTFLQNYYVRDGFRPDQVAGDLYDRQDLDWVVLHTAGIVNVTNATNATSTSTGSIQTAGGLSVTQDIVIGNNNKADANIAGITPA